MTSEIMDAILRESHLTFTRQECEMYHRHGREWFDRMIYQAVELLPMALLTVPTGYKVTGMIIYADCVMFCTNNRNTTYYYHNDWTECYDRTKEYILLYNINGCIMSYLKQIMGVVDD